MKQTLVLGGLLSSGLDGLEGIAKRRRIRVDLLLVDLYLSFARQSQRLHLRPYWLLRSLRLHFSHGHARARAVRDREREREREREWACVLFWNEIFAFSPPFLFSIIFISWKLESLGYEWSRMGMGPGRVGRVIDYVLKFFFFFLRNVLICFMYY